MTIRSIVGLTAFSPLIIASVMSLSTACAPKSRYRGPVNLAKAMGNTADKSATEKAAAAQLEEERKKYEEMLAGQADAKAATDALNARIRTLFATLDLGSDGKVTVSLDLGVEVDSQTKMNRLTAVFDQTQTQKDLVRAEGDQDLGLKISASLLTENKAILNISDDKKGLVKIIVNKTLAPAALGEVKGELAAEDLLSIKDMFGASRRVVVEQTDMDNLASEANVISQIEIISIEKNESGEEVRAGSLILTGKVQALETLTVLSGDAVKVAQVTLIDAQKGEMTIVLGNGDKSLEVVVGRQPVQTSTSTSTSTTSTTTSDEETPVPAPVESSSSTTSSTLIDTSSGQNFTRTGEILDAGSDQDDIDYN